MHQLFSLCYNEDEDEDTDLYTSSVNQIDMTPKLITLLRSSNWNMALERMRTHPQESRWKGIDGETALHSAFVDCTEHVPLSIVLGITSASENMHLVSCKMRGCTVLDSVLLSWCDMIRMDKIVPTYEYRLRFQVIHKLISLDVNVIGKDTLKYLFHFTRIWVDDGSYATLSHRAKEDSENSKCMVPHSQTNFIFALMDLILYVGEHNHMRKFGDRPYENFINRLITARSRFEYPVYILNLAIERFGANGCTEYDSMNRTPLIQIILSRSAQSGTEMEAILRKILKQAPGNASLPYLDNRFPLHLAIRQGYLWDTGLEPIVLDCTNALAKPDPMTHLYPFMQAAAEGAPLNTIFSLLQANPNVASSA